MSATVTCITERIRARLSRPLSDAERARQLVADRLATANVQPARIRHAQNRVERSVAAGFAVDRCVDRCVEWALSTDDNTFTGPLQRAPQSFDPNDPPPRAA